MRMTAMAVAVALVLAACGAGAQEAGGAPDRDARGPMTGLPLPRYVSMKAAEGFARRGPSATHRIDWVFKRRNMPLLLVGEYGQWRRVQDREGAGGWMHYSLLSGNRSVIVEADGLLLHRRPDEAAPATARLQAGVVAWLGACGADWCDLEAGGAEGWAPKAALWGVTPDELRE